MQFLPDNLLSLLRAEVTIASVARCVSELVHNSIDAGASHVDIILRPSPLYISVVDDGHGIRPGDMRHIGRRHYTSKCRQLSDLESISSYGFRGEALASIAAVSHLSVTSRHSDYSSTHTTTLMNASEIYNGPSSSSLISHGTHVVVQNLFNNLPVRRKSILGDGENNKSACHDIVKSVRNCLVEIALSLESEAVKIRFRSESALLLNLCVRAEDKNNASNVLKTAYGRAIFKSFDTFNARHGDVTVNVLVALELTATQNYQYIFINRRKLVHPAIYKTLSYLFCTSLGFHEDRSEVHPVFVVHVNAPLSGYDLCQDPGKIVVDLENYGDIETAILDAVRNFLSRLAMSSNSGMQRLDTGAKNIGPNWESPVFDSPERLIPSLSLKYQSDDSHFSSRKLTKSGLTQAKFISQIDKKFILLSIAENDGRHTLVIVDQHAADERVRLELLLVDYFTQVLTCRTDESWSYSSSWARDQDQVAFSVKFKCSFSVSQEGFEALAQWQVQLELWGVRYKLSTLTTRPPKTRTTTEELEEDELTVHVTHWPFIMTEKYMEEPAMVKAFLLQHAYDLQSGQVSRLAACQISDLVNSCSIESTSVLLDLAYRYIPRMILELLNSKACRGAIMFGDSLAEERSRELIHDLTKCRYPFQCAHGRPSMVSLVNF
ncbi:hypothetical protein V1525DRAFT_337051 [Lipomyces kononenkoae]|uniref:Uncharacterized protein n=1 Tax=Lipomyces kononenkoae TaxID=34357 RepID=A0ACC3TBS9_LIPKO